MSTIESKYKIADMNHGLFYSIMLKWIKYFRYEPSIVDFGPFDKDKPVQYIWKMNNLKKSLENPDMVKILKDLNAITEI